MRFDAAVIGAGPAGSWAAYTLAKRGARVAIFDGSHPREKPCGGGVTGRALALVADALPTGALPGTVITSARFLESATGRSAVVAIDDPTDLLVVSRERFDGALFAAARERGATIVSDRATNVAIDAHGARIETRRGVHHADFVVGADGANSLVRRRLSRAFPRRALSIATGFFARDVTSREILIELVADPPGYIWSFPRPDHLAIGICAQADANVTAETLRRRTAEWIRRVNLAPDDALVPYSWPIPSLDPLTFQTLELSGPRWCTIGDAAGLVDPLTREGIYFALASATWAADAIAAGATAGYEDRVRRELVPELVRAARLKQGFFRPAFAALCVQALARSQAVAAVMADLIAGRQSYAGLRWRLMKTMEWRLAWQLLVSGRSNRPVRES